MIYGSLGKSKPKKKTKKEIADYESWIKSVASMKTTFSSMKSKSKFENKFAILVILI